jgi:hypothetical protein
MLKTAFVPEEQHFILSSLSPDRAQRRLALAIVLALLVAFFITAGPLSTVQLARIEAFIPAYAAPMFVVDLIIAVLLFAQFSILRSFALLAIAIGYLFTALVAIPWVVCAATFVIIAGDTSLPRLMIDAVHIGPPWDYAAALPLLFSILALVILWARWRSVLDLWPMVVMCAYLVEICLTFYFSTRFSIGWYVGRACGFLSGSLVLFVLLYEITILYAQLLRAVSEQRREREMGLPICRAIIESHNGRLWVSPNTPEGAVFHFMLLADGEN